MRSASRVPSCRRRFAAIAFAAGALMVAACENANTSSGTSPSSNGGLPNSIANVAPAQAPSYAFVPYTVGNANSEITGMDPSLSTNFIAGVYYGAGTSAPYNSFTAEAITGSACGNSRFSCPAADPPNSPPDVYIAAINNLRDNSSDSYSVGFAPPFSGSSGVCTHAECGVVYDPRDTEKPHLYQVQDPHETGSCAATYLWGTSDPTIQVGYYNTGSVNSCKSQAFEEYLYPSGPDAGSAEFVNFQLPPGWKAISSMAYGINNKGDVVGAYTTTGPGSSVVEIGWEYHEFCYYQIQYLSFNTQARGINFQGIVVGSYTGSSGLPNGFVESGGTPEPVNTGTNGTFINNINTSDTIVGYRLGSGNQHYRMGFTATCSGSGCPPATPPPPSSSCSSTSERAIASTIRRRL